MLLLEVRGLTRSYYGIHALEGVDLEVRAGQITGLIGPNGAGKTSLFNVLTGIYTADGGEFVFDGSPLAGLKPHEVAARGIAALRLPRCAWKPL